MSEWHLWIMSWPGAPRPYDFERVEVARVPNGITAHEPVPEGVIDPRKMHPAMNVAGLYWRPAAGGVTEARRTA